MEAVDRLGQLGDQMYQVACGYKLLKRHDEYLINTDVSHEDDLGMTVTVKICPVLERKPECTASGGHEEKQLWQHLPTNEEEELSQPSPRAITSRARISWSRATNRAGISRTMPMKHQSELEWVL